MRRTPSDRRVTDDECGPSCRGTRDSHRGFDRERIVAVHRADHVPAIRAEPLRRVVAQPARDATVDRNAIGVVKADEFVEAPDAGERRRFMAYAFHEAAVADEHPGPMVDDRVAGPVE